jgi:hypothetical protein
VIPFVYGSRIRAPSWDREGKESLSKYFDFEALKSYHPYIVEYEEFVKHAESHDIKALIYHKIPGPVSGSFECRKMTSG